MPVSVSPKSLCLLLILLISALYDLRLHRVPNRIILLGFGGMSLLNLFYAPSPPYLLPPFFAAAGLFCLLLPLFALRALGAADLKLMMLVVFSYPGRTGLFVLFSALLFSGIASLYLLLRRRIFRQRLLYFIRYAAGLCRGIRAPYYLAERDGHLPVMPLCPSLFLAAVFVLCRAALPFF